MLVKKRLDRLVIEEATQLEARDEVRHMICTA
jgi:hypothetical protein